MQTQFTRRKFLSISAGSLALGAVSNPLLANQTRRDFKVSLNESSFHQSLTAKKIDHLDFAFAAKNEFGIDAVEYVSSYFSEHIGKESYIKRMNQRAAEQGVRQILIMVDDQGHLADSDSKKRTAAIDAHRPWVDLAKTLGCHSVCVEMSGEGPPEEWKQRASDSLQELAEYAKNRRIHLLLCCGRQTPERLLDLLEDAKLQNAGTYPCFAEFEKAKSSKELEKLMPLAKGVRATSKDFDNEGNETSIDFARMVKLVLDAGYRGHVGINYRGTKLDERSGILATKKLLERALTAEMTSNSQ